MTRSAARPRPAHLVLVPAPELAEAPTPTPMPTPTLTPALQAMGTAGPREVPAVARHLLTAIRVAMGFVFLVCGLNGLFDVLPHPDAAVHATGYALGHSLLLAGSMLPLLKGTEVLLETVLDLYQQVRGRGARTAPQFSPRSE